MRVRFFPTRAHRRAVPRAFDVTLVLLAVVAAGCTSPQAPPSASPQPPVPTTPSPTPSAAAPTHEPVGGLLFDESRALALGRAQVIRPDGSIRYRVPGTPGVAEAAGLIADALRDEGLAVRDHFFNATYGCEATAMRNVVGVLPRGNQSTPAARDVVYLGAHYDSRPIADKDPDPARRDAPIQGAIDGAGAVGVLLELARALAAGPALNVTVAFAFFDGEDGGGYEGCTEWILGSTALAAALTPADVAAARGMVLLDLVGAADGRFPFEGLSADGKNAPQTRAIWAAAARLGVARFVPEDGRAITDDHVPFARRGIPVTDVIDQRAGTPVFAAYHHTHADNVDALDARALGEVGRTVEAWVRGLA